ncbi:hypothetical protein F4782DRAFT_502695 [Xylaria castorea]|nr:hypothetical protein F4782DRAFT_502695 [Xylaria castorea]
MEQLHSPATVQQSGSLHNVTLRYLQDHPIYESTKPYVMKRTPPLGVPRSNVKGIDCNDIVVHDVRGHEADFHLGMQGFAFGKLTTQQRLDTPKSIECYITEVREFLTTALGCDDVRIFEYKLRSSESPSRVEDRSKGVSHLEYRAPSKMVHIDQTCFATKHRIRTHFPDDCDTLLKQKYRFVNVWRPLVQECVVDCPLALCDASTLSDEDLVECDLVYESYEGEHYKVKYNRNHRW